MTALEPRGCHLRRREFITLVSAASVAWPLRVRAQKPTLPVIGFLHSGSEASAPYLVGFEQGLKEIGFENGRNVTVQYRFAEGHYDRLPAMVADFVYQKVTVLAAVGGVQTALAAKPASAVVPVVFANGSDPVQFGLVKSLNRPDGNITGVSFFNAQLEAKRLGLLSELVPSARAFGALINPANDNAANQLKDIAQGARVVNRAITILKASNEGEIETMFASFAEQRVNALLVASDPYFNSQRTKIVELAARYNLPAIYEWSRVRRSRRTCELRDQSHRQLSPGGRLRGTHSQRRETGRATHCADNEVRIRHQSKDRKEPWSNRAARSAIGCRCGDRVASNVRYWHLADISRPNRCPLLGVKRTSPSALHMSAFDPKRTFAGPVPHPFQSTTAG